MPTHATYELRLRHGEHHDSSLYRFERGDRLRFRPDPTLLGRKVFLYTNYVIEDEEKGKEKQTEFVRSQYYCLPWRALDEGAGGALAAALDVCAELELRRAGAFHYYFVYDTTEAPGGPQGSGWFHVPPALPLPLDALMCQTVLAKCLGPLPRWEAVLRVAREAGYNMLHFTPVQVLGASDSSYSIADQLRLDPRFGADVTFADVGSLVSKLRSEWQVTSICDVVLNHTANETAWLTEQSAATYNCGLCPHLRPAALLDVALVRLSAAVARGNLLPRLPSIVNTEHHIQIVKEILSDEVIPQLRLHEMYTCDVEAVVQEFLQSARNKVPGEAGEVGAALRLVADGARRRNRAQLVGGVAAALRAHNVYRAECYEEEGRLRRCAAALRADLERLNAEATLELAAHLRAAVDNCVAGMRYFRLQEDGPKIEEVSDKYPLVPRYFTYPGDIGSVEEVESLVYSERGRLVMAHNGWVMNADPLLDFAAPAQDARVYLRRELIAWGDSVKLRYGDKPEDSPFLWSHMRQYVELTASVFDGLRLDNCHSTPLHVAEYMIDCARRVRPELYVVAELFTNSDNVDNIFVNRLGVTSLIREAQSAWDAREQGRLVHRFGGRAAGAPLPPPAPRSQRAAPRVAHALLLDLTHDNPSPLDRRCVFDLLPAAALVAMACCATGSTRGYDELVPHHVHVVDEVRLYPRWDEGGERGKDGEKFVDARTALVGAKRALNDLHRELAVEGYSEVYVDQMDEDVVAVTRHNPLTRQSVILVAFTAFRAPEPTSGGRALPPLRFEGDVLEVVLEASVRHADHRTTGRPFAPPNRFVRHPRYINGLDEYQVEVRQRLPLAESVLVDEARHEGAHTVVPLRLKPGGVVALRVAPRAAAAAALVHLHALLAPVADPLGLEAALAPLALPDLTTLLYACDAEERDRGAGGTYEVPGHGPLVYAGLQGALSALEEVRVTDDLGHPLCANLRAGDWLPEYTWRRLAGLPALAEVAARYRSAFGALSELPRFLVPAYFDALVARAHAALERAALVRLGSAGRGPRLARSLALTSVQLAGATPSAALPPPSPRLSPPPPMQVTLSAGLPHFSVGYMRCWGRDTFIALRGMFLLTGRYEDARAHILGFAACLRHGLIPNLLDGGRNARYNCRDATWWWLLSIKQYCAEAPQGEKILSEAVSRVFPTDDSPAVAPGACDQPLSDVMQEALDRHFQGLVFRERNAGPGIDAHMTDKGFNVQIGIDPETGFPFGGNDANCGTWMDKMGSSERAGTRGRPATPRDGSAVELVGLAYCTAEWLAALHGRGAYPHQGLARVHPDGSRTTWSWRHWAQRIRDHFERHFWVPSAPSAADARPDLVNRRAIYKDSHGASHAWPDYQLRCNFPIAMVVAPDLFEPKRARLALDSLEQLLLGPLGVKTLDPEDWAYRGDYDNSNDSDDPSVAHGFNYHQGPEWVWPIGFYLRARLAFAPAGAARSRTVVDVLAALAPHAAELEASPWRGLPELTGAGGAFCRDSCRTQAWSSATLLEVLHDLDALLAA